MHFSVSLIHKFLNISINYIKETIKYMAFYNDILYIPVVNILYEK